MVYPYMAFITRYRKSTLSRQEIRTIGRSVGMVLQRVTLLTTVLHAPRFWKMTKPTRWAIAQLKKMRGAYSQWRFRLHRAKAFPAAP
jgi:hypothetical protein